MDIAVYYNYFKENIYISLGAFLKVGKFSPLAPWEICILKRHNRPNIVDHSWDLLLKGLNTCWALWQIFWWVLTKITYYLLLKTQNFIFVMLIFHKNPTNQPLVIAIVENLLWVFISEVMFFLLSLRVFGLLFSCLLLFPQRFGRYVLRHSSGVCQTREPSQNFELRPLLNPRGSSVLIPLAITGYKC